MSFVVIFEDAPTAEPDIRARFMQDHLNFLQANKDRIDAAGPLLNNGQISGGLWVVNAQSPEEVSALVHKDPFWPTGLRKSVRILAWRKVFADGKPQGF